MRTSVTILGQEYTVVRKQPIVDERGTVLHGLCDTDAKELMVCESLSEIEAEKTLLHEAIHAVLFESGWSFALDEADISEEGIVRAMEHALWRSGLRFEGG